jgi:hypothetical protein
MVADADRERTFLIRGVARNAERFGQGLCLPSLERRMKGDNKTTPDPQSAM